MHHNNHKVQYYIILPCLMSDNSIHQGQNSADTTERITKQSVNASLLTRGVEGIEKLGAEAGCTGTFG